MGGYVRAGYHKQPTGGAMSTNDALTESEREELERLRAERKQWQDASSQRKKPEAQAHKPEASAQKPSRGRDLMEPGEDLSMPLGQRLVLFGVIGLALLWALIVWLG